MTKLEQLQKKKAEIVSRLNEVDMLIAFAKGDRLAQCYYCKKRIKIKRLIFIQTRWYTPPHGCTEGDYWNDGEGQWVCPHCREVNRMLQYDWCGNQAWMVEYKHLFAARYTRHGDNQPLVDKDEVKLFQKKWKELYGYEIKIE